MGRDFDTRQRNVKSEAGIGGTLRRHAKGGLEVTDDSREKPHPYEHGVPPSLEYRLQAVWFVVPPSGGTGPAREDRLKAVLRT